MPDDPAVPIHQIGIAAPARLELEHLGERGSQPGVSHGGQAGHHAPELAVTSQDRQANQDHVFARGIILEDVGEDRPQRAAQLIEFGSEGKSGFLPRPQGQTLAVIDCNSGIENGALR